MNAPAEPTNAASCTADFANMSKVAFIEQLLAQQQTLSAVDEFAQSYDARPVARGERYRKLLPTAPPGPGQQYAFEVDLDRCSGCKACVTACHNLNGLDASETWRDVGLLIGGTSQLPIVQHVTTACHHCLTPACLTACPVNAYEKDPSTGIVRHLDDQCFGCQYCTLACPYEVPKYHAAKGIVRKCDMCSARLAAGEAPACVQACPNEAIAIRVVNAADVIEDAEAANFLPAAPDAQFTLPTTAFKTRRVFPRNMLPADYFQVSRQHPHWPLVVMLVLTQLSVGAFGWEIMLDWLASKERSGALGSAQALVALLFGLLALGSSVLHLGRPRYAFRAILGIGHSWLSREILAFGLFAGLACGYAILRFLPSEFAVSEAVLLAWGTSVVAVGVIAILCSVLIYASINRAFWSFSRTIVRFTLTSIVLGLATTILILVISPEKSEASHAVQLSSSLVPGLCQLLIGLTIVKLSWEAALARHLLSNSMTPLRRSALLSIRELATPTVARFSLGVLGGAAFPALILQVMLNLATPGVRPEVVVSAVLLFAASLAGELLERYLFFAAVATPRMPGGIR